MKDLTQADAVEWHHLDAKGKVLGRLASMTARLLLGKHRLTAAPHAVAPVNVVITNSDYVVLTGNKEQAKMYRRYTGYPGGLRERSAAQQRQRDSRRLIVDAVSGMLPKNSLRDQRLAHLKVYPGAEHPHQEQVAPSVRSE
jgi:large subunit ribosomal protein L13